MPYIPLEYSIARELQRRQQQQSQAPIYLAPNNQESSFGNAFKNLQETRAVAKPPTVPPPAAPAANPEFDKLKQDYAALKAELDALKNPKKPEQRMEGDATGMPPSWPMNPTSGNDFYATSDQMLPPQESPFEQPRPTTGDTIRAIIDNTGNPQNLQNDYVRYQENNDILPPTWSPQQTPPQKKTIERRPMGDSVRAIMEEIRRMQKRNLSGDQAQAPQETQQETQQEAQQQTPQTQPPVPYSDERNNPPERRLLQTPKTQSDTWKDFPRNIMPEGMFPGVGGKIQPIEQLFLDEKKPPTTVDPKYWQSSILPIIQSIPNADQNALMAFAEELMNG